MVSVTVLVGVVTVSSGGDSCSGVRSGGAVDVENQRLQLIS
jgi:hypothetical protein